LGQQNKQNKNIHNLNMKLTKIVAISSLAALAITPVFAGAKSFKETVVVQEEAKPAWSASLSTGWDSLYMFRGANVLRGANGGSNEWDNGIQWTAASFTYNLTPNDSITLSPWMGYGLASTNAYKEFDLALNYAHTIDALTLGLGYTFYDVMAAGSEDLFANELNASVAYNLDLGFMKLTPSVTYFYNLGPDNGENFADNHGLMSSAASYLSLRLDGSVAITDRLSLNPYVAYGINFRQNWEDNEEFNGSNNVEYGVAAPFKINNTITVSAYIAQSIAFQELNNTSASGTDVDSTRQFTTFGGAKVTFSF
jgi:hypothetical protein